MTRYTVERCESGKWAIVDHQSDYLVIYRAYLSAVRQCRALNKKPHDQRKRKTPCLSPTTPPRQKKLL